MDGDLEDEGLEDSASGFATGGGASFDSGGGRGVRITHLSIVQAGAGGVSFVLTCYPPSSSCRE